MLGDDGADVQFLDKADHWRCRIHFGDDDGLCADRLEVAVENMTCIGVLRLENKLLSMQFHKPYSFARGEGVIESDSQHHFIDIERFKDKPWPQSRTIGNANVYRFLIQLFLHLIDRQFKNRDADRGIATMTKFHRFLPNADGSFSLDYLACYC